MFNVELMYDLARIAWSMTLGYLALMILLIVIVMFLGVCGIISDNIEYFWNKESLKKVLEEQEKQDR